MFSIALLTLNAIIFRDITLHDLLFVALSFVIFAAIISTIGNWLSIRFPKRMSFGKRMNVSGVAGMLLIPMIIVLAIPPLFATAAGYVSQSLLIMYLTLAILALVSLGFTFWSLIFTDVLWPNARLRYSKWCESQATNSKNLFSPETCYTTPRVT